MTDLDARIKQLDAKLTGLELSMGRLEGLVRGINGVIDAAVLCFCKKETASNECCATGDSRAGQAIS